MTYILELGPWHVGPFPTHVAAQYWAETHGVDDYRMIPLDDPASAGSSSGCMTCGTTSPVWV